MHLKEHFLAQCNSHLLAGMDTRLAEADDKMMHVWCIGALYIVQYAFCKHMAFFHNHMYLLGWQNDTWWIARLLKLLTAAEKSLHSKSQSTLD